LLKKKVVIVTGASKGIGAATALTLASEGYLVVGTYNTSAEAAFKLKESIEAKGGLFVPVKADVKNISDCERVIEVAQKEGQLYGLVNNAGINRDSLVLRMSIEDWLEVINTNLNGAFYMTRLAVKEMLRSREGSIVNVSSVVGIYGNPGQANYSASKAALIGFTKSLAKELGPRNIRVNAVAPGFIETDMTAKLSDDLKSKAAEAIALKRFGRPEEVAEVIAFLISERASYITGEIIEVSGGISL
jgi:3-oxoacyl-[acyl-carrier protein] reductase